MCKIGTIVKIHVTYNEIKTLHVKMETVGVKNSTTYPNMS